MTARTALVTGANRGIGQQTAVALARRGFRVVVTHRADAAAAQATLDAVRAVGAEGVAVPLDLRAVDTFPALVGAVGGTRLDVLVNNAGVGLFDPMDDVTPERFDEIVGTNLRGTFFLTQALLPLLGDGSRIVNVTTSLTRHSSPATSVYTASKAALEALTRSLAVELGPRGIRVLSIAPGPTATDFNGGAMRDDPALRAELIAGTALRAIGDPARIGAAIAALADDDFDWATGERLEISGGVHL